MRRFLCPNCSHQVYFNNRHCGHCNSVLGYLPLQDRLVVLQQNQPNQNHLCGNRDRIGCNWLCENNSESNLCLSCQHTTKIPDTSDEKKLQYWRRLERAKRQLFYEIIKFGLPLDATVKEAAGFLHFELISDEVDKEGKKKRAITGHHNGRITINIDEADDVIREKNRTALGEPYRTLVGHFRHEVAHYYWNKLIHSTSKLDSCRACFGDERQDYGDALEVYYKQGAKPDWQQSYVSAYASAHPWEDFAETWAHYFHMVGGLETAYVYGLNPVPIHEGEPVIKQLNDPYHEPDHAQLMQHWIPLTIAMNAMNRSIGNHDYYPFSLSPGVSTKLKFIHDLIKAQ